MTSFYRSEKGAREVLAILGAHDALLDSADTRRRLEACVPHAEIEWRPAGGHLLIGQAERIRNFLLRPPSPS